MITLTKKFVNDIAQNLQCGLDSYINKETGEFRVMPNDDIMDYNDDEELVEEYKQIQADIDSYYVIRRPRSSFDYDIMESFATDHVEDQNLREKLLDALQNRKPFRNFKAIVDYAGDYREQWFAYRQQRYMEYVEETMRDYQEWDED